MKKILALILCVLTLLPAALAGCGTQNKKYTPEEASAEEKEKTNYEFFFESTGEGNCKITGMKFNYDVTEEYTLVFPSASPSGETVTDICLSFSNEVLPDVIPKTDFEALLPVIEEKLSKSDFQRFLACYIYYDLENAVSNSAKNELIKQFPCLSNTPIYAFATDAKKGDRERTAGVFAECGITLEKISEYNKRLNYYSSVIIPQNVTGVELPDTLETERVNIGSIDSLTSFTVTKVFNETEILISGSNIKQITITEDVIDLNKIHIDLIGCKKLEEIVIYANDYLEFSNMFYSGGSDGEQNSIIITLYGTERQERILKAFLKYLNNSNITIERKDKT